MAQVSIIIQARSTSKRFPKKIFAKIGKKQVLQHVLDACHNAASYVNKRTLDHGISCGVCLVVPEGDELISYYANNLIIQGSESDVLSRYAQAASQLKSDYIVRITSDCPFIPSYIISKCISIAAKDNVDFLTNADPKHRTFPDGWDIEIMSRKLLEWLDKNALEVSEREHVTKRLYSDMPLWAKRLDIVGFVDWYSMGLKLSIDTEEDLNNLTKMHLKILDSIRSLNKTYRL